MTAEEYLIDKDITINDLEEYCLEGYIRLLQDFATIKCKEQRELCAKESGTDLLQVTDNILNAKQPEV